jgi:hypothetical protein
VPTPFDKIVLTELGPGGGIGKLEARTQSMIVKGEPVTGRTLLAVFGIVTESLLPSNVPAKLPTFPAL